MKNTILKYIHIFLDNRVNLTNFLYQKILARRKKTTLLHCLWDSHLRYFKKSSYCHLWENTCFKFCEVPGATASGLNNPNSKTKAYKIFSDYVEQVSLDDNILLCLWEVDCGFVIWWRAQKYNEKIENMLNVTIETYIHFIKEIKARWFTKIIVCSAILPSIQDDANMWEIINARKSINSNLIERTIITQRFNLAMKMHCSYVNIDFLDLEEDTLDKKSGTINKYYLNKNPCDHHLDKTKMAKIIIAKLKKIWFY